MITIMMILLVGQDYFEVDVQDKGYTSIFAFGSLGNNTGEFNGPSEGGT